MMKQLDIDVLVCQYHPSRLVVRLVRLTSLVIMLIRWASC